jgi:lia operon protein LiaF
MYRGSLIGGIILVVIGMVFLMDNLGYTHVSVWRLFRDYWPVLIIWVGADMLYRAYRKEKRKSSSLNESLG